MPPNTNITQNVFYINPKTHPLCANVHNQFDSKRLSGLHSVNPLRPPAFEG